MRTFIKNTLLIGLAISFSSSVYATRYISNAGIIKEYYCYGTADEWAGKNACAITIAGFTDAGTCQKSDNGLVLVILEGTAQTQTAMALAAFSAGKEVSVDMHDTKTLWGSACRPDRLIFKPID